MAAAPRAEPLHSLQLSCRPGAVPVQNTQGQCALDISHCTGAVRGLTAASLWVCCSLLPARLEHRATPSAQSSQENCTGLSASQLPWNELTSPQQWALLAAGENASAPITSSKNSQSSPASLFQLHTGPRRAAATASLLTLTSREDKIAFEKQWKVTSVGWGS